MRSTLKQPIGPQFTPPVIRWLILITCVSSVSVALIGGVLQALGYGIPLHRLLTLNSYAYSFGFIWQPLTYFFIQSASPGLSLFLVIQLLFYMYMVWILGTMLVDQKGAASFLRFYLSGGIVSGLCALLAMVVTGQTQVLAGSGAPVYGVLLAWAMLYPMQEVLIFFVIPAQARWIVVGLLLFLLLTDLSVFNWVGFVHSSAAFAWAYLYAVAAWGLQSPFSVTQRLDGWIGQFVAGVNEKWATRHFEAPTQPGDKIWKLKNTDQKLDEDAFLDEILSKISEKGEESLTSKERRRLHSISKRGSGR